LGWFFRLAVSPEPKRRSRVAPRKGGNESRSSKGQTRATGRDEWTPHHLGRNAPPENTAVDESEVGSTGWAGRLIVRRELQISRKAAPKGHSKRQVGGWIRRRGWKVNRRRKPKVSRKAAEGIQRTMRVGSCGRRQGRKVDQRRRSRVNQRAAPGERSSR